MNQHGKRLKDLSPRWLGKKQILMFLCPCCEKVWLTVKTKPMIEAEQFRLFATVKDVEDDLIVPTCPDSVWTASDHDFSHLTVTPALDASETGHFYGWITNGHIIGAPHSE